MMTYHPDKDSTHKNDNRNDDYNDSVVWVEDTVNDDVDSYKVIDNTDDGASNSENYSIKGEEESVTWMDNINAPLDHDNTIDDTK